MGKGTHQNGFSYRNGYGTVPTTNAVAHEIELSTRSIDSTSDPLPSLNDPRAEQLRLLGSAASSRYTRYGIKAYLPGWNAFGNYLATGRLMAAASSAFSMYLATEAMLFNFAALATGVDKYEPADAAKIAFDTITIILSALTFIGMASGAYFAQAYRLQPTITQLKEGRFKFGHVDNGWDISLLVSTCLYGLLIGFSTLSSILGFFTKVSDTEAAHGAGIGLGAFFGFAYCLLTINYCWKSIEDWKNLKQRDDKDAKSSWKMWIWYLFANMSAQVALNIYLPSQGVAKLFATGWDNIRVVLPVIGYVAMTVWSNIRAQQTSFLRNSRKAGGILGNITHHHAGMPSVVPTNIRVWSNINRFLANFAVCMMIPGNGNALAQLFIALTNLVLVAREHAILPLWAFPIALSIGAMIAAPNALAYLAFNTVDGKDAFDWRILTGGLLKGRIPSYDEMGLLKGIRTIEDRIEVSRKRFDNSVSIGGTRNDERSRLEKTLINNLDRYWHAIMNSDHRDLNAILKAMHDHNDPIVIARAEAKANNDKVKALNNFKAAEVKRDAAVIDKDRASAEAELNKARAIYQQQDTTFNPAKVNKDLQNNDVAEYILEVSLVEVIGRTPSKLEREFAEALLTLNEPMYQKKMNAEEKYIYHEYMMSFETGTLAANINEITELLNATTTADGRKLNARNIMKIIENLAVDSDSEKVSIGSEPSSGRSFNGATLLIRKNSVASTGNPRTPMATDYSPTTP